MALINTTTTGVLGSTFYGDGSGALTVQQNGVTQGIYGNIPAFSAVLSTSQTGITSGTFNKIQFNTEFFDTNNNYDSTTNYRFTPTIAGYYQINASLCAETSSSLTRNLIIIYKNGSQWVRGGDNGSSSGFITTASTLVYCNGSTDYIEIYGYLTGTGLLFRGDGGSTCFSGFLVKAA